MNFEKIYVLFQFTCNMGYEQFEEIHAVRFKYCEGCDVEKEIDLYKEAYLEELMNKAWDLVRPDFCGMTVKEVDSFLKNFYLSCNFCTERITKSEYKGWKEDGKSGKITFI